MPTYVTLVKYTQKGIEDIKHAADRLKTAKERARSRGGEIKAFYLVLGQYDAVIISEAPNDESAATGWLFAGSQGYVRTETLRAFTEDEFQKIVAAIP